MKITPEHYEFMRSAMAQVPADKVAAHREALKNDPRVRDLNMRLRWDVLHATVPSKWICDNIYPYANDTHIDTALKRIMGA
jgi:hypothetical protein